jgi:hypothetical protein
LKALGVNDAYTFSRTFNHTRLPLKSIRMVHRLLPPSAKSIELTRGQRNDPPESPVSQMSL